ADRAVSDPGKRPAGIAGSQIAHLVIAFSETATLWDADTGARRGELAHPAGVTAVALSSDGRRAATGDAAGADRMWNNGTQQLVATCSPHAGDVRDIKFAPDGAAVVSGGNDGEVRICDAVSGATRARLLGHSYPVITVDISGDGQAIVSA